MTKEEIKDELYRMLSDVVNGGYPKRNNTQRGRYREAVKEVIKALEQEPKLQQALEQEKGAYNALVANVHCNDCIRRAEAINAISHTEVNFTVTSKIDFADYKREIQEIVDHIVEAQVKALNALPPVSPQQKKTQMIDESNFDAEQYKIDLQSAYNCGKASVRQKIGRWKFTVYDANRIGHYECSECHWNVLMNVR